MTKCTSFKFLTSSSSYRSRTCRVKFNDTENDFLVRILKEERTAKRIPVLERRGWERGELKTASATLTSAVLNAKGIAKRKDETDGQWNERVFRAAQGEDWDFLPAEENETLDDYQRRFRELGSVSHFLTVLRCVLH